MREIEIFPDNKSMIIEDDYTVDTFNFFPEEKKFTVESSIKDDVFYNNSTLEYVISSSPIEIKLRTIELSHEPPFEYSIRDGVVLESELKKSGSIFLDEKIKRYNEEVEWHKIPLYGQYAVNFYLLSLHPEIIPESELRKYLRQTSEKIKSALQKIEKAVSESELDLEVSTSAYGDKMIWYKKTEELERETSEYININEEMRGSTPYAKRIDLCEEFKKELFNVESNKFVGIEEDVFKRGQAIVNFIEAFLTKRKDLFFYDQVDSEELRPKPESSSKGKWFVLIAICLIALEWGIWTALGTFILGYLIIKFLITPKR